MIPKIYLLTAFPKEKHGGNKAGVVINANVLSEEEMQKIAKEINYSETAFVLNSENADFRVRFYTPTSEVNLCGHATVATFNLLRDLEMLQEGFYTQETKAGILKLDIRKDLIYMEQVPPIYGEYIDPDEIEDCFVEKEFVDRKLPIRILSTGMKEIFIPVKGIKTLNSLSPMFDKIVDLSRKYKVIGVHCFSLTNDKNADAYGRNFAPIVGIDEESATGTSNGALGCYLNNYVDKEKTKWILRQGYSMGLPSEIITKLTIRNEKVQTVFVGGTAKILEE
jgi:PhzF family phenazine biosynthesis protein